MPDSELPPLPDAQLEIMKIVWDRGETTAGEVWKAIASTRPVARNTILTLMTRLAEKGWLRQTLHGNVHRYSAAVGRESALNGMARRLVQTAFEGSVEGLLMSLLKGGLSRDEAQRIRAMLDAAERNRGKKPS